MRNKAGLLLLTALGTLPAIASAAEDVVAVNSKVFNGYTRTRLADNSFKPEHYTFGEGHRLDGPVPDKSVNALPFAKIARALVAPLASRNFVMSVEPDKIDLLIVVHWGTTTGTGDTYRSTAGTDAISQAQVAVAAVKSGAATATTATTADDMLESALIMLGMENRARTRDDTSNAAILGFTDEWHNAQDRPWLSISRDLSEELGENRYFVILKAYDFQFARKEKKSRLLWTARFSVRERGNDFSLALPAMAAKAAQFFGRDSAGLVREAPPEGRVEVGTPRPVDDGPRK